MFPSLPLLLTLLSLLGCAPDVIGMYADERAAALLTSTGVPSGWQPDARLRISPDALTAAISTALKSSVSGDLPATSVSLPLSQSAQMQPSLTLDKATISPTDACSPCLEFDGNLLGKVRWNISSLTGSFPFEVAASGILAIEVENGKPDSTGKSPKTIRARLTEIRSIKVRVMEIGGLGVNPSSSLEKSLQNVLLQRLQPIKLTTLDTGSLPVLDLRLATSSAGLSVDLLTDVPTGAALPALPAQASDVEIAISEASLLGLARRAAFTQGPVSMDVALDPRAIMFSGDRFTMQLRLWRLIGKGWWRDYTVTGKVRVENGQIKLVPEKVTEGEKSPGAGFVDPMAALFEGTILSTIEKGMRQSLPATHSEKLGGGVRLASELTSVEGSGGALIARARIAVLQGTGRN